MSAADSSSTTPQRIYLVSHPKIVFLYPTFLAALVAGIVSAFIDDGTRSAVIATVFLAIFGVNLVVLSFDFPRGTSLTLFFCAAAIVLGLLLLFRLKPDLWPEVSAFVGRFNPRANPTYYFTVAGILGFIYLLVLIIVRFDYWEVRPNELLHHHGLLSDLERFAAPNLKIDKEINDVFEYLLLRSGRLILHPSNVPRSIVLENVFFINSKERELTRMLSALRVQVSEEKV